MKAGSAFENGDVRAFMSSTIRPGTVAVLVMVFALAVADRAAVPQSQVMPTNGEAWPARFRPYGAQSPWNRPLPENPRLMRESARMIASAFSEGPGEGVLRATPPGRYDYSHPVYVATASDPLVTTKCFIYCSRADTGFSVHVPAKARPAQGDDHHLGVVQPDGMEYDFWEAFQNGPKGLVTRDWRAGDVLYYGGGGRCSNVFTGSGFEQEGGPTAGGACLAAGRVESSELEDGTIRHALFSVIACVADGVSVFPANQALHVNGTCLGEPSGHIPLGARLWLDLTDSQVNALGLSRAETVVLQALHHYGAYVMDIGTGCGDAPRCKAEGALLNVMWLDPPQEAWSYGHEPPGNVYARRAGWGAITVAGDLTPRYVYADPWRPLERVGGPERHVHIVDPCYAKGSC